MAAPIERCTGVLDVHALERGGESIRITFASNLAVGNDVQSGALLIADRADRRIILRFFEKLGGNPPQFFRASARRKSAGKFLPIDQPVRLRIRTH